MSENIITITNVSKYFKEGTALKDVTIAFEKGKIHGIIGRNGSGKTVLFKCICGFIPPSTGEIVVNGKVIGKDTDIPDNVGIIIEAPGFLPNYSGFKNLCLLASINHKIKKDAIRAAMIKVGLDPNNKKHVSKYSMGMRQRLGIAQAIMENPEILILDEPMNGLDLAGVKEIRELLKDLKDEGKTIILSSHNSEDIRELCDTVCEMDAGILNIKQI
ncbi:MAG TPA: ATP-binding cassette domain-containing protein [Acetivibrio clariflavus]|nr:ATP-binding cassette domain-containing protein [Acetivibrio clariflavus]HPU42256.1 ATP-binding cassette domain-containing protein [Acetivibrio clariflavus]